MPPWGFDVDAGQDIRHLWYHLLLIADIAQGEAQQVHLDYERNMQHKDR
jgi:hypothetical protein